MHFLIENRVVWLSVAASLLITIGFSSNISANESAAVAAPEASETLAAGSDEIISVDGDAELSDAADTADVSDGEDTVDEGEWQNQTASENAADDEEEEPEDQDPDDLGSIIESNTGKAATVENDLFTGAANYHVPIVIPPGRSVFPELGLHYNSYGDNGWAGMGWSLDMGYIQRATKRGLGYGADDYIYKKNGSATELKPRIGWGTDYYGAETEQFFSKYFFNRTTNGWEVTVKDGTVYYYGSTAESRQENGYGVFKWHLDRVVDTNKNYMVLSYLIDEGHHYLKQIIYTGNEKTGDLGTNQIDFIVEARPDPAIKYTSHSRVLMNYRLDKIEVRANGELARRYDLEYMLGSATNRSVLHKIRIFGSDGQTQLKPFTFHWQDTPCGTWQSEYSEWSITRDVIHGPGVGNNGKNKLWSYFGDINGDGLTDILYNNTRKQYSEKINPFLSNGDGTFSPLPAARMDNRFRFSSKAALVDVNGDGLGDLVGLSSQGNDVYVSLNKGNGSWESEYTEWKISTDIVPGTTKEYKVVYYFGDINGDGLVDLLFHNTGKQYHETIFPCTSNGDGTFTRLPNARMDYRFPFSDRSVLADVNGDGLADIVGVHRWGYEIVVSLNKGNGLWESEPDEWKIHRDMININHEKDKVYNFFGDINGDGLVDVIFITSNRNYTEQIVPYLSKGDGTFRPLPRARMDHRFPFHGQSALIDVDGDGMAELLGQPTTRGDRDIYLARSHVSEPADLLKSVVDTLGSETTIQYRSSAQYENKILPFILQTVQGITVDDKNGVTSTKTYDYADGFFSKDEREFWGFGRVTQTNPNQSAESIWFLQDKYRHGLTELEELTDVDSGSLLTEKKYIWGSHQDDPMADEWAFVKLTHQQTIYHDGEAVVKGEENIYDDENGYLTRSTAWGTIGERVVKKYVYTNLDNTGWMWRKTQESIEDDTGIVARKTDYVYFEDGTGNLKEIRKWYDEIGFSTTSMGYDDFGNKTRETDSRGNDTLISYENVANTFPETITYPSTDDIKHSVVYEAYDYRHGKVRRFTNQNKNAYVYDYDPFGRLKSIDYPDGGQIQKVFNDYCVDADCSNVTVPVRATVKMKENDASFMDTTLYYDGLGRTVQQVKTWEGNKFIVAKSHYDQMGWEIYSAGPFLTETDDYFAWIHNEYPISDFFYLHTAYDKRGRPVSETTQDDQNGLYSTVYEYNGFNTKITDPDQCSKTELRDHMERIVGIIEHADNGDIHTRYVYNAADDLLEIRNHFWNEGAPHRHRTLMEYDLLGQKVYMDDPDMGQWSYEYDLNGNLVQQTDAKAQRIRFTYDELNRVTSKAYLDTADKKVQYEYDHGHNGIGLSYAVTKTDGKDDDVKVINSHYNEMGRLKQSQKRIKGTEPRTTLYDYDYSGKVTRLTYPHIEQGDRFHLEYAYYPGTSLLKTVTGSDGTVFATMDSYTPTGKIGHIGFENGVETRYGYDGWSKRLIDIHTVNAHGKDVQNKQYIYTPAGDIKEIDDNYTVEHFYYTYDKLHRLTGETSSTGTQGVTPAIVSFTYDNPDHIHAVSSVQANGRSYTFNFDSNGNLIHGPDMTEPSGIVYRDLEFDADNMPVSLNYSNGAPVTVTYDGDAKRAKKSSDKGATYYFSDEFEISNTVETRFIFAGNLRIAKVTDAVVYYHKDHLSSSTAMTDGDGEIVETTRYLPYGGKRGDEEIHETSYLFTDQEFDAETGFYNYDARLYDPAIGSFISADSIVPQWYDPQSLNRYAYCRNNPLKYVDPTGHAFFSEIAFGDFNTTGDTWGGIIGNVAIGFCPIAGQVADARDSVAAVIGVAKEPGSLKTWGNVAVAALSWVAVGDWIKGAKKTATKVDEVADVVEEAASKVTKNTPKNAEKTFDQARREAFEKAGMTDPDTVKITKHDKKTGTAVEFKGKGGSKVGYDAPHDTPGQHHDTQHISWQSAGKRGKGGKRGNIPYSGPRHPSRFGRK